MIACCGVVARLAVYSFQLRLVGVRALNECVFLKLNSYLHIFRRPALTYYLECPRVTIILLLYEVDRYDMYEVGTPSPCKRSQSKFPGQITCDPAHGIFVLL